MLKTCLKKCFSRPFDNLLNSKIQAGFVLGWWELLDLAVESGDGRGVGTGMNGPVVKPIMSLNLNDLYTMNAGPTCVGH